PEQLHPHHRRLLTTVPSEELTVKEAARSALKPLMYSAFRRPVEQRELDAISDFVERTVLAGRTFPQALKLATQSILVSPHFLFRLEPGSTRQNQELIHPIGDYALASRLSYCLWKTLPDETLLQLAERNALHTEDVLRGQVVRMLDDPRSSEFVHSFFGQWLGTQKIPDVKLDRNLYPAFSTAIKNDLLTESMMFAESIMREKRSVLDILRADYSFMNKRLANYYGISTKDWTSAEFRRVSLDGLPRRGMLTQGGILMLTSFPNRTSPTKRGKWILETILNEEPPPPPADVPTLENSGDAASDVSLRQQLEEHRRNPRCASCHQVMDSIGFGLENFDAAGQWRDKDGDTVLDAGGTLPSGESFSGPVDLIQILLQREEDFVRCVVEKLMTFTLGRGVEHYDRPAIDQIIRNTKESSYRFNDLIAEIVLSRPFLLQRGEGIQP
ncbi:MAG: DUF1592 domain-containing protein, partial [Planctomycetaceae bacterium]|nr:DUF1592 domain-containing protein [Planctomycetaceae bacterium]